MFKKVSKVLGIINKRGINNPIKNYELTTIFQLSEKDHKAGANLRSVVNALRDKGYPVCANGEGYYYPQTPEELAEYIRSFQNRIDQQQEACNNLKTRHQSWVEMKATMDQQNIKPATLF